MAKDQDFPEWLKAARVKAGLNQRELAEATGIPLRTIQEYEQGRCFPSMDRGLTLLATLGTWDEVKAELTG